ncbi:MAG: sensor histidine kinase [Ardenticatenaceae bacterium]
MTPLDRPDIEALLQQQESLREVIEAISSELELRPLLTRVVRHACGLLGADRGSIGLVDDARNVIRTEAVYCMPEGELGAETPPGVGLAGRVLLTQRPLLLDRYGTLEHPTQPALFEDAVLGVPIFWQGRMVGFFGIGAAPPRRFTPRDVEVLSLFARHAATAIANARRYEEEKQRTERLALITRIGQRIAARLDPTALFNTTVDELRDRLGYDHISLFLLDQSDPQWLVQRARASRWPRQTTGLYRQSIEQGILGAAARQRAPELVNDVAADPRYVGVPGAEALRAELAMPILLGERLLGVLDVAGVRRFREEDVAAIQIIADQLAVAIDNAHLFAETGRALRETQLLYETSQRISAASTVDEVIVAYLEQVAARRRYACTIVLYEFDEAGERTARVTQGRWTVADGVTRLAERTPYAPDALDPLLDAGRTVAITDVHNDPRVPDTLRQLQQQDGRPALALIPLMEHGGRIGLVVLSAHLIHEWSDADLWPYQTTAAQLATAVVSRRQHRLLYERGQQLAALEERQRLARDLHDSVTQLIFSMTLIAQAIAPAWRRDPAEGERRTQRLLELSQSALAEMRALLAELRPDPKSFGNPPGLVLGDGLAAALQRHITDLVQDGLPITLDIGQYAPQPPDREEALYRITQEALNNVVKHAHARHVAIALTTEDEAPEGSTRLTIQDDGAGFTLEPGERPYAQTEPAAGSGRSGGLGLLIMRERAEALGGRLQITTASGHGTTITVTLPREKIGDATATRKT